jgi:hypothetical protein
MEMSGQLHASAALPLWKYPLLRIGEEAGCAPDSVWTLWTKEFFVPAESRDRAVQPVTRRYTDWSIAIPDNINTEIKEIRW